MPRAKSKHISPIFLSYISYTLPLFYLPLLNIPLPRHLRAYNLIAIEQAKRVKRLLQLAHGVDGLCAQLVRQVVALH